MKRSCSGCMKTNTPFYITSALQIFDVYWSNERKINSILLFLNAACGDRKCRKSECQKYSCTLHRRLCLQTCGLVAIDSVFAHETLYGNFARNLTTIAKNEWLHIHSLRVSGTVLKSCSSRRSKLQKGGQRLKDATVITINN